MTTTIARRVILESPYAADTGEERNLNTKFACLCMRHCITRYHEYPFASHLLYTQRGILDDNKPNERQFGIDAGLDWGQFAEKTVVYTDFGITKGMQLGIENAEKRGRLVEYRHIFRDNKKKNSLSIEEKYAILDAHKYWGEVAKKVGEDYLRSKRDKKCGW